jgi:hypothetical protein
MERDLTQLLRDTADRPVHSIDPAEVVAAGRRRRQTRRLAGVAASVVVVLAMVAGLAQVVPDRQGTPYVGPLAPGDCPVTVPDGDFVPPQGYSESPPDLYRAHWYGTEDLWTMLKRDGETWSSLPERDGVLGQRVFLWSIHQRSPAEESFPDVTMTAQRLDADAPVATSDWASNGQRSDLGFFMVTGVGVPTAGCWEITAKYRGASLSWVVLVEAD